MEREELIDQVQTLFPYLDLGERLDWIERLEDLFPSRMECIMVLTKNIGGTLPPPAPGDPHVWLTNRTERNSHWHGMSRLGPMECRMTLREATKWIMDGGQDECW